MTTRAAAAATVALVVDLERFSDAMLLRSYRARHAAVLLADGPVLVAGGRKQITEARQSYCDFEDPCSLAAVELLDPGLGSAADGPPLPSARESPDLVAIPGGALLVGGLFSGGGCLRTPSETFLWDRERGTWEGGPALAGAFGRSVALLPDGRVLAAGGNAQEIEAACWLWRPGDLVWSKAAPMRERRYGHACALLGDGRVLVAGGLTGAQGDLRTLISCEIYDPRTEDWTPAAPLATLRTEPTLSTLRDGSVLAIGGANDDFETATDVAERWDPKAETWSRVGSLAEARFGHTATALADGRLLVVGGVERLTIPARTGEPRATAELYDPRTQRFSTIDGPQTPRWGHTATLLGDGRVLIVGGEGRDGTPLSSAEVWVPSDGR